MLDQAISLYRQGRLAEAASLYRQIVADNPHHAEALGLLGVIEAQTGNLSAGIALIDRAIEIDPKDPFLFNNRGNALRDLKRFDEALISFDRALALNPDFAQAHYNRGHVLTDLARFEEALSSFDCAHETMREFAEAHHGRGNALLGLNRFDEALESFDRALGIRSDYAEALLCRGLCKLAMGDLPAGWAGYEHRWRIDTPIYSRRLGDTPDWGGENLRGRSILVYAEQGSGDSIQFARYLPLLAKQGAKVAFLVDDKLLRVLKGFSDNVRLMSSVGPRDRFDFQCALMSLPYRFQTDLATIPSSSSYLCADEKRSAEWAKRIGANGFKIGIHWQGGLWQGGASIAARSIPLRAFFPVSQIPGVRLISLQKDFGVEQLSDLPAGMRVETLGEDFDSGPDAFVDSAAVIASLDLIVTCDTSIAHLAAALGRPTWVALKWAAEWRWLINRSDSPWYPTMRLFRQKTPGDWNGVFQDIAKAVRTQTALEKAVMLHRQGRLREAASLYRDFLGQNPRHAEALGLLGVIEVQAGNLSAGIELLDRAIAIDPNNAILFNNRGNALRDLRRFDEALISFDRAVALKPDFAQAFHNRGNVLRDLRRFEEALESFDSALGLNPGFALAHFNRGNALQQMERPEEAVSSFDRALAIRPNHADTHNNRGIALQGLKRFNDALISFNRALAIQGGNPGYLNNLGNVLLDLKRFEEALASFNAALASRPDYAEALYNRGIVLRELKRYEHALESVDQAIALKPDYAEAHGNRGAVLCDLKRPVEAISSLDRAIAINPRYAGAFLNRGVALRDMKRPEDALESFDRAIAIAPNDADLFNGRGVALQDLERFDEALRSFDQAVEFEPAHAHAQAFYNRGMVLLNLMRPHDALSSYARALALQPDYPDAEFARGVCKLTLGELPAGWAGYEHRWRIKTPAFSRRLPDLPDWTGEYLNGRSILVYAEQGSGDTIQFARYLPLLAKQGAAVAFLVDNSLLGILEGLSNDVLLISSVGPGDRFDFQCALMSLPYRLQTSLATIPSSTPYLRVDPKLSAVWTKRIGAHGFKIGIHWQGGLWQGGPSIAGRSIPLREFFPLSQIAGARLISLQKNFGIEQLAHLPPEMAVETLGEDFDNGPDAFVDSAAMMECLDLIVTCDTSIAHLAGALGRPTWIVLKHVPDWRWMLDRSDSPWYPTMRLFRQRTWGDWGGAFREIAAAGEEAIAGEKFAHQRSR